MRDFKTDYTWQETHIERAKAIIKENLGRLATIEIAPDELDMHEVCDAVFRIAEGMVAVRLRRAHYLEKFQDVTFRSYRESGMKTELAKIREGFARWYLFGWIDEDDGSVFTWLILDMDRVRKSGLLNSPEETINFDRETRFVHIGINQLFSKGCIVAAGGPR